MDKMSLEQWRKKIETRKIAYLEATFRKRCTDSHDINGVELRLTKDFIAGLQIAADAAEARNKDEVVFTDANGDVVKLPKNDFKACFEAVIAKRDELWSLLTKKTAEARESETLEGIIEVSFV